MPSPHEELAKVNKTLDDHQDRLNKLEKLSDLQARVEQLEEQTRRLTDEAGHTLETPDPEKQGAPPNI